MTDEKYEFLQDCRDKKITARSARSTRTHCGKGGAVKFPSDYLTEKEKNAMNGKCESYRMNDPMTWEQFKSMPKDLQIMYIKALRKKYNVPDKYIAEMMGISRPTFCKFVVDLGLGGGKGNGGKRVWDKEGFFSWCGKTPETVVEDESVEHVDKVSVEEPNNEDRDDIDKAVDNYFHNEAIKQGFEPHEDDAEKNVNQADGPGPVICTYHNLPVIPKNGTMTFEYNDADDALSTIKTLLSNVKVNLTVSWECIRE